MAQTLVTIAKIHTGFPSKFGVPRQSGLVKELTGRIVFEEEYRNREALKGLSEYSHLWLLWDFSLSHRKEFSPTVYPPRLGGNIPKGVWATRSPFRPNSIGLSCVRIEEIIEQSSDGPQIIVSGVDMVDGTPIYDIKPYLPYTDSIPDARGSFGQEHSTDTLKVDFPKRWKDAIPAEMYPAVRAILEQDPRAAYNKRPGYVYGMEYNGYDIRFTVENGVITVTEIVVVNADTIKIK